MKIIVNSLPKSGTHLLAKLVEEFGFTEFEPGLTGALVRETHRNPFKNWQKNKRRSKNKEEGFWIDLDVKENWVSQKWLQKFLGSIPDGKYINGHLPYSEDLSEFLRNQGFKLLYIIRDPRDIILSYINHQIKDKNYPYHDEYNNLSLEETIEHTLYRSTKNKIPTASLKERIENSLGWLADQNVCSTSFEELVGPKGGGDEKKQIKTINEICAHLSISHTNETITDIAGNIFDTGSKTFNKGLINQWEKKIDQKHKDIIVRNIGDLIEKMGYAI